MSSSGDEGSLGFDPPDEFIGWFGYSRDHEDVEFGAMNISVMDQQDPQDKAPIASPAPTGVSQEIPTIRPRQFAGIPRKLRRPGVIKNERYDLHPLWRETLCEWAGRALGTTEPLQRTLTPLDRLGTVSGVREKGRQWRELGQRSRERRVRKRNRTGLSPPRKTEKAPKGYMCPWEGEHHTWFLFPPAPELPETVQKVIWEGGKGVRVVPARKREMWFWSLGEIEVAWWDISKGEGIFWDGKGKMLSQEAHLQYPTVHFNALGIEPEGLNQTSLKQPLGDPDLIEVLHQGAWRPEGTTAALGLGKRPVGMKRRNWNVLALKSTKEGYGPPDSFTYPNMLP